LYEGFGLPVVEAFACGAPVVVSNTSSLTEVAGDAALLLPPQDRAAWAATLRRLWHDDALRADLARRGPPQARQFSWQRAAAHTLAIYRRYTR
jgi:glycosyltransferase involved in cell wall biosynthesis